MTRIQEAKRRGVRSEHHYYRNQSLIGSRTNAAVLILQIALLFCCCCCSGTVAAVEASDTTSATTTPSEPVQLFITSVLRGEIEADDLWIINPTHDDNNLAHQHDELLFMVESPFTTIGTAATHLCQTSVIRPPSETKTRVVVPIIGYYRPGVLERFCLWDDGLILSMVSRGRPTLMATTVGPAPSLGDLVALVDTHGVEATCVPPAPRGIWFETLELICFALGHKPAVIRQRQIQGTHNNNKGLIGGVPANLFVPHTRVLLRWLMSLSSLNNIDKQNQGIVVWSGLSKNEWGTDGLEHSIVLTRDATLGRQLVDELRVQDASVPHQPTIEATAYYIARVGAAIGYAQPQVRLYMETSGVLRKLNDSDEETQVLIDTALREAFETCTSDHNSSGSPSEQQDCSEQQRRQEARPAYAELPNFRSFLESEQAGQALSSQLFRQVVEPLDDVFFFP